MTSSRPPKKSWFSLSRQSLPQTVEQAELAPPPAAAPAGVLILDSDPGWVAQCAAMLEQLGHRPHCAFSTESALTLASHEDVGLALIGAGNKDAIARLRAHPGKPRLILLETRPQNPDELHGLLTREPEPLEPAEPAPLPETLLTQLSSLSEQVLSLQRLAGLASGKGEAEAPARPHRQAPGVATTATRINPAFLKSQIQAEERKRKLGGGELFSDPAWSLLLDLLLAEAEGRPTSVSSACIACAVPTTTAMRLINRLVASGILNRIPDEHDGRRDFLTMAPAIHQELLDYLAALAKCQAAPLQP